MKTSFIIVEISDPSEKGNVTLRLNYKKGLVKQSLYLLTEPEDVKDLVVGQDIADMIPSNFTIRTSEFMGDAGSLIVTKWIELV